MESVSEFSQESYYVSSKYYYYFAISASLFFISQSHLGHLLWNSLIPWQFLMALWRAFWGLFNPLVDDPSACGVHAFFTTHSYSGLKKTVVAIFCQNEIAYLLEEKFTILLFELIFFFAFVEFLCGEVETELKKAGYPCSLEELQLSVAHKPSTKLPSCLIPVVWQSICSLDYNDQLAMSTLSAGNGLWIPTCILTKFTFLRISKIEGIEKDSCFSGFFFF